MVGTVRDVIGRALRQLESAGALRFGRDPHGEFEVVFRVDNAELEEKLEEFLELTGIDKRPSAGRLALPFRVSAEGRSADALVVETRSVLGIIRTASRCIDIPKPHLWAGIVEPQDQSLEDPFIRIRTSLKRPRGEGTIAIRYRRWWYYVDDADPASKQAFKFLRTIVGLRLYEGGKDEKAPVLTIPVG